MAEEIKIKKEMTIAEAIKLKPTVVMILMEKGMHCLGCAVAQGETIEQAAQVHDLDVNELIDAMNSAPDKEQ